MTVLSLQGSAEGTNPAYRPIGARFEPSRPRSSTGFQPGPVANRVALPFFVFHQQPDQDSEHAVKSPRKKAISKTLGAALGATQIDLQRFAAQLQEHLSVEQLTELVKLLGNVPNVVSNQEKPDS